MTCCRPPPRSRCIRRADVPEIPFAEVPFEIRPEDPPMTRRVLLPLLLLALAACGQTNTPPAQAPVAAATAAMPASADEPALGATTAAPAAASTAAAPAPNAAAEAAAQQALAGANNADGLVEGRDYEVIKN